MCPKSQMKCARSWVVVLAALVAGSSAHAAPIVSTGQNLEVQRRSSGTPEYSVGQAQAASGFRVGFQSGFYPLTGNVGGIEAVYFFKLPELPAGQKVAAANFAVSLLKPSVTSNPITPGFNVDVYALGYDLRDPPANDNPPYNTSGIASTTIAQDYFFVGPDQASATLGQLIGQVSKVADNFVTGADFDLAKTSLSVPKTTSVLPGSSLANYIQGIYDNPSYVPGGYLALRLTPDAAEGSITSGTVRYQFPFAPGTGPSGTTYSATDFGAVVPPQIDITFVPVPEPTALGAMALVMVGLLKRRR